MTKTTKYSGKINNMTEDKYNLLSLLKQIDSTKDKELLTQKVHTIIRQIGKNLIKLKNYNPYFREVHWEWLSDKRTSLTKKEANKFMLGCILDIRVETLDIWDNTRYIVEEMMSDPNYIWHSIKELSPDEWNKQALMYDLHPDPEIHTTVYKTAGDMVKYYKGDARRIWGGLHECPEEIYKRLKKLGLPDTTASMIVGALKDEKIVSGSFNIMADDNICRVLGRIISGNDKKLTPYQATSLAKIMNPADPWQLDRPVFIIALQNCKIRPDCVTCPAKNFCVYNLTKKEPISSPDMIHKTLFGKETVQTKLNLW